MFNTLTFDHIPEQNPQMRAFYYYLGCGRQVDSSWFENLDDLSQKRSINLPGTSSDPCPNESIYVESQDKTN